LANYITFMCSSIVAGLFAGRGHDVVLASSPPLFVGAAGWLVAQLLRIPFVFDVRDIWPDVAVDAGEFAANAPVVRFLSELADSIYAQADCIIPVTETKQTRIRAHGVPDSKMRIVPNGVDLDLIPDCPGDVRPELDLIGRFVVLYAGLIGVAQGLEIVTEAAELLRDTDEVRFLIVGDGVRRPALEDEIHRRRLRNVVLLPSQQREAMPAILNTGDVCLVPLSSAGIADAVPSKLLEAWAYRRPVILAAAGESADIVRKVGGGVVIGPRDAQALAQTILLLKESPEVLAKQGAAGRLWVENSLDRRKLADLLASVLEDVVENSGRKGRRRQ
jgi:glycosyltransferase involved in cell wall biosynthesis